MAKSGVSWDSIGFAQLRGRIDADGAEISMIEEIDCAIASVSRQCFDDTLDGERGGKITVTITAKRNGDALEVSSKLSIHEPQPVRRPVLAIRDSKTGDVVTQSTRQVSFLDRVKEEQES
jgi:hypothetical protein